MKSFTPKTSFSNSRAFLASLLTCIMLVAPLTPIGYASTSTPIQTKSGSAAKQPSASQTGAKTDATTSQQKTQPVAPLAVGITATKTDNRTNAQPVGPTNTINYTVTISNGVGADPALAVVFNDTIDPNTTLVPSSIQVTPLANPDTFNVIGNVRIQPNAAQGLLANDFNPDNGNNTGLAASGPTTSTQNGNVSISADGSFSYNPAPGFTGTDTFTYTVTNTTTNKTDTSTVTLLVGNGTATPGSSVIWFIDSSNAAAGRDGRLTNPFNSIAEFNATAVDDPGDIIFVNSGTYTGPVVLLNNQQLIGRGVDLATASGFTVQPYSDTLPTAGTAPTINSAAAAGSDTVTLNSAVGANTIRGVVLGNASDSDIEGTSFGTLTISATTLNGTGRTLNLTSGTLAATFDNIATTGTAANTPGMSLTSIGGSLTVSGTTSISGATLQGISIANSGLTANFNTTTVSAGSEGILIGTSNGNITFGDTTITGGTHGVSLSNNGTNTRTFGRLAISGGSGSAFNHTAGGGNVTVNGASASSLASTADPINIQNPAAAVINFTAGAGVTKTTAGGAGVTTAGTNTSTLTFNTLSVTTSNGTGVNLSGGTFNVTNATGSSISATGSAAQAAPAILASGVAMGASFATVSSTNSGTASGTGMSLTNVTGTLTMNAGAISGATSTAFLVNGQNGSITYNGTINTSTSNPVNVTNKTGGTVNFGGAITSTGSGVTLTSNPGATINFTNGLSLTTGANAAFTATGGGTVNATQNNSTILNTVSTTTGTGVNIATPTNIGGSGVTFRSVTVNNGASNSTTNAIILNGTTGAFTVSGDGSQTGGFFDRDGSGGTINRTTGHSVTLTNATNVTLRQMNITNTAAGGGCPGACTSDAVHSSGGGSIVLSAVTLQNLGGNGWRADNITGTNAINHNSRIDTWNTLTTNGVSVANTTTSFASSSFTVDKCLFTTSATGADGFLFDVDAAGGGGTVTVTNSEFTLIDQDAVQINHDGSGILNAIVQKNNFHDADATAGTGNNTLVLVAGGGGGQLIFTIGGPNAADGNTFTNLGRLSVNSGVLQVQASGGAAGSATGQKLNGTIQNNTLTNPAFNSQWRGIMAIAEASGGSHGGHIISIKNNSVQNFALQGIYTTFTTAAAGIDNQNNHLNISNNSVGTTGAVGTNGGDSGSAIEFETNNGVASSGSDISVNALIANNVAIANNASGIGTTLEIGNQPNGSGNTSNIQATVLGNSLTQQNASGETFEARNILDSSATMCLDLNSGNTSPNNSVGGTGGFKVTNDAGSYAIEGLGASTPSGHLGPKNQSNGASPATITSSGTFINSAGCTNSTAPVADPDIPTPAPAAFVAPGDTSKAGAALEAAAATAAAQSNDITSRPFIAMPQAAISGVAKSAANSLNANARTREIVSNDDAATQGASPTTRTQGKNDNAVQPLVANFPVNIGTLNGGKSVTITFSVTVNNPLAGNVTQISNQGSISGSNFSTVQTDDPDVAGANNATITPVIPYPTITINNASITEPSSGSANMPFPVVLSSAYTVPVSVSFQTADGSATAGSDYTSTSGTLNFAAGDTFQTISVPVLSDADAGESNETFTVTLNTPVNGTIGGGGIGTGTITTVNTPGRVLISEVRTSGPNGAGDDFVELYNNQDVSQNISGWAVFKTGASCPSTPVLVGVIPAATTLPPRGHYLIVGPAYNAANFGNTAGNPTVAAVADIEADRNIALFNTSTLANLTTATREDAVAFDINAGGGFNCDLLREGATLLSAMGSSSQYSYARNLITGLPKETNDNAADFLLVTTTPAVAVGNNLTPILGAPGPENLAAPIQRNAVVKSSLIDGTVSSAAPPNRVRSSFGANPTNAAFGTLSIQRRFKNTLGVSVTRLRFRIVDLTTINNRPPGQSDLRVLSSTGAVINSAGTTVVTVTGLTLEGPPQPNGGGLNSTLTVIPPGGALAPGATIDVQFLLGVQEQGNFSFFVNVEALPAPPGFSEGTSTKSGATGKQGASATANEATEPKQKQ
ncbi:MAG TPA: Calx-beta domain-containing protein [Pyrinomonadaceae bacterium]|nr:Calx-beta domain-containing protein [Pyrinomonadaceae bacterium]